MARQRRGGGLSVRARDADDFAAQEPAGELDIADHFHALPALLLDHVEISRHAGRKHDQIGAGERRGRLRLDIKIRVRPRILIHRFYRRTFGPEQLAAATPLRAIPITTALAPSSFIATFSFFIATSLSQLQCREGKQRRHEPGDPKSRDHL